MQPSLVKWSASGNTPDMSAFTHAISFQTPHSGGPGEIIGIDVAILNFVRAYCRYTRQEHPLFVTNSDSSWDRVVALATEAGVDHMRLRRAVGMNAKAVLAQAGTLFHPDPHINSWFWHRARLDPGYAVCGLTHTMTGSGVAGVVGNYLTDPSAIGDALICPSHAIKAAVQRLLGIQADYLNHRFKTAIACPVELPVIPLAIDTTRYAALGPNAADKRAAQRTALQLNPADTLILSFGRISHYTKAHPLPLLLGAERAAQALQAKGHKGKLHLVCMGFFSPLEIEPEFRALAADICKTVQVDFISKDDPRFPDGLWAGADTFTSLVDNYQESFGLTPIEAMAAGLPSVITDWDGYRDGVRHGIDGIQIHTAAPPPLAGMEIADHAYNGGLAYLEQLAASAQSVAVDIDAVAAAFILLASDPMRRQAMGRAAQVRARSTYDWAQIIPAYEDLWDECAARRRTAARFAPLPNAWPAVHHSVPDLYAMFDSFPTRVLQDDTIILPACVPDDVELVLRHPLNQPYPRFLMEQPRLLRLLGWIYKAERCDLRTLYEVAADFAPELQREVFWRTVGWMLKCGFIGLDNKAPA